MAGADAARRHRREGEISFQTVCCPPCGSHPSPVKSWWKEGPCLTLLRVPEPSGTFIAAHAELQCAASAERSEQHVLGGGLWPLCSGSKMQEQACCSLRGPHKHSTHRRCHRCAVQCLSSQRARSIDRPCSSTACPSQFVLCPCSFVDAGGRWHVGNDRSGITFGSTQLTTRPHS